MQVATIPASWCDCLGYANGRVTRKGRNAAGGAGGFFADVRAAESQPIPTGGNRFDGNSRGPKQRELARGSPIGWFELKHDGRPLNAVEAEPRHDTSLRWTVQLDKEQCRARASVRDDAVGAATSG